MPTRTGAHPSPSTRPSDEFNDLVLADEELLRAEFDAIVAREWPAHRRPGPPEGVRRGGGPPPHRSDPGSCRPWTSRRDVARPWHRQRSPPLSSVGAQAREPECRRPVSDNWSPTLRRTWHGTRLTADRAYPGEKPVVDADPDVIGHAGQDDPALIKEGAAASIAVPRVAHDARHMRGICAVTAMTRKSPKGAGAGASRRRFGVIPEKRAESASIPHCLIDASHLHGSVAVIQRFAPDTGVKSESVRMTTTPGISQLRLIIEVDDFDDAVRFYRDVLGMPEQPAFATRGEDRVAILHAGAATIELATSEHIRTIDDIEGAPSASD